MVAVVVGEGGRSNGGSTYFHFDLGHSVQKRCWSEICIEYPTTPCDRLWKPIALQQMWLYCDVKYAPSA